MKLITIVPFSVWVYALFILFFAWAFGLNGLLFATMGILVLSVFA